ncbi:MAG TPA: trigger factor [Armatimonadota bacterium]|nr:trigger factor [Armatimonadota bacterium]
MQVTLEQVEPCIVAVTVEVDAEAVQQTIDRVFKEVAGKVAVPGFRKGKAPRSILERFVDQDAVRERAISQLVPEHFAQALREKGVEPFAPPEVSIESFEVGQPLRFTATVPTRPEVRLCDYRDLPVRRRRVEISDADVDLELDLLRRRHTELVDADAEVAGSGLVAIVDLDLYRGERHLKKRSQTDVALDMDQTDMVPAFNVAIEGARIGETREMPVHFPDDFQDPVLAGKDVTFKITVKALKTKQVPELNDEFAQKVSDVADLAALRDQIRQQLEESAREVAEREVRDQLVEQVVSRSEVHFPEVLVQEQTAEMLRRQASELERQNLTIDDFLRSREIDFPTYERELREDARRRIRTQLVLEQIAEQEKIEVTDEEIDQEIERMASSAGVSSSAIRAAFEKQNSLAGLRTSIFFRKVVDLLVQSARIVEE